MDRRPVRRLDPEVVNRIAAGEVVQRPANALKEMIENCLDAQATTIQVIVKDGGMKYLQIQDNGIGIPKEDLGIICERFTTSKLKTFDDLCTIATYGFRGEALSSISHVAHITIVTKTPEERCGYKVSYIDGKMKSSPTPCGSNQGTQITVENFFYNVPTRQKSLKNSNEEFQRIYDVVSRYAVHNASVGFSLKLFGRDATKVKTLPKSTAVDNIRSIFGNVIARDLMELKESDEMLQLKIYGQVTNLNYHSSKFVFLLFINHRLVESEGLKKELDQLYSMYLPQGTHPFIYLSLEMAPQNVDVNVHPTKHSVFYLHEDAIKKKIKAAIQRLILGKQACKSYQVQVVSQLSMANPLYNEKSAEKDKDKAHVYAYEKVRTNSSDQKLDRFLCPVANQTDKDDTDIFSLRKNLGEEKRKSVLSVGDLSQEADISLKGLNKESSMEVSDTVDELAAKNRNNVNASDTCLSIAQTVQAENTSNTTNTSKTRFGHLESLTPNHKESLQENDARLDDDIEPEISGRIPPMTPMSERREFHLTSLEVLRRAVVDNCHTELKTVLKGAVYVGCIDDVYILMQHETNLYLCKIVTLCEEFFYQVMLSEFGNLGVMKLSKPLKLYDLLKCALDRNCGSGSDLEIRAMIKKLTDKSGMLEDYFSLEINEEGYLVSIPWLLREYSPCPSFLPEYLLGLVTEVDWTEEKACFQGICEKTAELYSRPSTQKGPSQQTHDWNWTLQHVLFAYIKKYVYPSKTFVESLSLCHITCLRDLYIVFERC